MYLRSSRSRVSVHAGNKLDIHCFQLDLADLLSVKEFARQIRKFLGTRRLNLLASTLHGVPQSIAPAYL